MSAPWPCDATGAHAGSDEIRAKTRRVQDGRNGRKGIQDIAGASRALRRMKAAGRKETYDGNNQKDMQEGNGLDLAFQVNGSGHRRPRGFEKAQGFARQESDPVVFLLEEILTTVVAHEASCLVIRFKPKFFRQEAELDVRLVTANTLSTDLVEGMMRPTLCRCSTTRRAARAPRTYP